MELCQEFLIELFYTHCKRPLHKKYQNVFNAECPICKEGTSSGRTRRLYYFPNKEYFYCHNCSQSWKPYEWVKEVTGLTFFEILKRNNEKMGIQTPFKKDSVEEPVKLKPISDLPKNCIDLSDPSQVAYYKDHKVVKKAVEYCKSRRLLSAVNTCKKFYVSVDDKIYKNRLIIPFFDESNKIASYQARSLFQTQFPKYLTKFGDKPLFGINNIRQDIPYIFVFEGPIDSMFVRNGVATASLASNEKQATLLRNIIGFEYIYVYDNDKGNKEVTQKIENSIKAGKRVFIWPKELERFKDLNELACHIQADEIPWKFIVSNSAVGPEALIKYKLLHVRGQ